MVVVEAAWAGVEDKMAVVLVEEMMACLEALEEEEAYWHQLEEVQAAM